MKDRSKNRFTLKIISSYLVLGILLTVSALYIRSEVKVYMNTEKEAENDLKFIKTGAVFTQLYEAESHSKLALQTKSKAHFTAYVQKIDTVLSDIDTLKRFTSQDYQRGLLDSVQVLLKKKVANGQEFRNLKEKMRPNAALDQVLSEFQKMEASLGKITAEGLAPNIATLSPKAQKVIRQVADYLNENIPEESKDNIPSEKIDSILNVSKLLLTKAKLENFKSQRSLAQKEIELNRYDMELSHQLHQIIAAFEQEIVTKTYNDTLKKRTAFRRGIRFAGLGAILGLIVVLLFTFLISRDFWKVQRYRQQLEKEKQFSESLLKSREQLISTVSHDLRTPLNTITGYGELLEGTTLNDKQFHYLKHMTSASRHVDNLVNDLLDFSKLEAGQLHIEKIPFVLSNIIQETSENMKALYHKKPIRLILDIDSRFHERLMGDPFRIRQLLDNLLGNAYKFTQEGEIRITAKIEKEANGVCHSIISIRDTGIGIKKEKQDIIFKEFTQADTTTEKKYGGYGLGLTISKKLTNLLEGSLHLESEVGKGSTFYLRLPLTVPKTQKLKSVNAEVDLPSDFAILILDDDPAMLSLLREFCESMYIKVHAFSSFNAIPQRSDLCYQAVLTDIQMPNINGFEVLQQLQSPKYPHYIDQPVMAMTGRTDLKQDIYSTAGFAGMLQKPFQRMALASLLKTIFPLDYFSRKTNSVVLEKHESALFNISAISSFLGENTPAITEVLQTFCTDSMQNIADIQLALKKGDMHKVAGIAHKMLPMFRQIAAHEIIPILEQMEQFQGKESMPTPIEQIGRDLKIKIDVLVKSIAAIYPIHPNCND
ncbi:hybrid sensor histidine kinase/response regulator [Spongiimicrobium salis]|uniref:hybrid sensor histidine kinase/response regulator n=1 Tax=Spongiimicrobium salis TaxID=1667022 RepID=UPI00374DE510